jgi:hypothetical protein
MRRASFVLFACIALAACEPDPPPAPAATVTASTDRRASTPPKPSASSSGDPASAIPKVCEKAAALKKRIEGIDVEASRVTVGDIALPQSKDGTKVDPQLPLLVVTDKEIRLQGEEITNPKDLAGKLPNKEVLLAIPKGEEAVARIVPIVDALGPDVTVHLLATLPDTKLEPAPKSVDFKDKNTSEKATELAKALSRSIDTCGPAKSLFSKLATVEPSGRAKMLREQLPQAVSDCECKIHDDALEIVAFLLGGDPPVVAKRIGPWKDKKKTAAAVKGLDGQKLYDTLASDGSVAKPEK